MINETRQVIKADKDYLWLQNTPASACVSCQHNGQCGVSSISKFFTHERGNTIKVANHIGAKTGDRVDCSIQEKLLLKSSFVVYFVPVLAMLFSSVAVKLLGASEPVTILAGIAGLFLSAWQIKSKSNKLQLDHLLKIRSN